MSFFQSKIFIITLEISIEEATSKLKDTLIKESFFDKKNIFGDVQGNYFRTEYGGKNWLPSLSYGSYIEGYLTKISEKQTKISYIIVKSRRVVFWEIFRLLFFITLGILFLSRSSSLNISSLIVLIGCIILCVSSFYHMKKRESLLHKNFLHEIEKN